MTDILGDTFTDANTESRLRQVRAQAALELETIAAAAIAADSAAGAAPLKRTRRTTAKPKTKAQQPTDDDEHATLRIAEKVDLQLVAYIEANYAALGITSQEVAFRRYAEWARAGNGVVEIVYRRPAEPLPDYGRYSAVQGSALASFARQLRATLARRRYWQVDIKNCHPTLHDHAARETFKMRLPCLQRYVAHRDEVLAATGWPRATAKRVMLIMSYGGNAEKLCGVRLTPFLRAYKRELEQLADRVYRTQDELVQRLEAYFPTLSNYRIKFKVLSYVCQHEDARMSLAAMQLLRERGWVPATYMHDGFLVEKRTDGVRFDAALLAALDTAIAEQFGYTGIHFERTALPAPYTLPAELQHLAPLPGSADDDDGELAEAQPEDIDVDAFDADEDPVAAQAGDAVTVAEIVDPQ